MEIGGDRRAPATVAARPHARHCLCRGCPRSRGSVAGDWLADRWSGLRARLRRRSALRDPGGGVPLPAWVIDALAEPDPRDGAEPVARPSD
ncbi:MAG TPA: hypothetical protein VGL20_03120 [Candidatus Dormibacteraeota bacterium]